MEALLAEHREREANLRNTLLTAQRLADEIKEAAHNEAKLVIKEAQGRADLFVAPASGKEPPRSLLTGGLPEARGGPRWDPSGAGIFAVAEDAGRLNPLLWIPLQGGGERVLATGTELNADPYPWVQGADVLLFFTAQGASGDREKRWRRIYAARLEPEAER